MAGCSTASACRRADLFSGRGALYKTRMSEHRTFRPSPRAFAALAAISVAALGLAAYMRYQLVEPASVGLVCDAGAQTALCTVRRAFILIFVWNGFGVVALIATAIALLRPSVPALAVALAAGFLGVVLYNTQLSALALALLPLVFARPAAPPELRPE